MQSGTPLSHLVPVSRFKFNTVCLFLQLIALITQLTRPAICLSEVLSQEELEQLVMLICNIEYNNGNVSWGGAWAGHAITCLLQDTLEGKEGGLYFIRQILSFKL